MGNRRRDEVYVSVSRRRRDVQLAVREERGLDSEGKGQKQCLLD